MGMNQVNAKPAAADAVNDDTPGAVRADGMRILWDAPSRCAALIPSHAYDKAAPMREGYKSASERMVRGYRDIAEGRSIRYVSREVVDLPQWVPGGLVCLRLVSHCAGCVPGVLAPI